MFGGKGGAGGVSNKPAKRAAASPEQADSRGDILVYQDAEGTPRIEVRLENETIWLTQQLMAELFQTTKQNIGQHLKNVFAEGELAEDSVVKKSFTTAADGKRYDTAFYNLDAIIGGWPVQFLPPSNALIDEAVAEAVETDVEGVTTRIMTAEHLVAIALQLGRAKDHARVLQFMEAGCLNHATLQAILARYGIEGAWARFRRRFMEDSP